LFDISVRFSVIHLSSECVRLEAETRELPRELKLGLREHPSLGNWVDALGQATERLESHSGLAAIPVSTLNAAERAFQTIARQELVNLRNETRGHAYTFPQREYEQLFQMRLPHITEVIDNLQGLLSCDLSCVRDLRYEAPGRFQVGVLSLVGSNPVFASANRKSPAALLGKHVVIFRDGSMPLLFTPPDCVPSCARGNSTVTARSQLGP
jgi:hypothetical protein